VRQLVALMGHALGLQPMLHFVPARPDEPAASWADISLLRETVGFTPTRSLKAGLAELASDYEARQRLRLLSASGDKNVPEKQRASLTPGKLSGRSDTLRH
jgi:hypothetical protein